MANGLKNSLKFVAAGIALSSASAAFATCGSTGCGTTTPPKPTTPTQPTQPIYNTPSAGAAAGANAGAAAGAQAGAQSGSLSGAAASNQADLKASQTANQNTQVGVGVNSSNKNDLTANAAGGAAKSDANATGGAAKSDSSAVAGDSSAAAKTGDVTVGGTTVGGTTLYNTSKNFSYNAGNQPGVAGSAITGAAFVSLCQIATAKDEGGWSVGAGVATPNGGAANLGVSKKGETNSEVKPDKTCYEAFMAHEKAMADKANAAAQSQATVALDRDMLNKGPVGMALVVEKNYKDQAAAITAKDSPTAKLMGLFAQPTTKPVVKKPAAKKDPCVKSVNVCKPQ